MLGQTQVRPREQQVQAKWAENIFGYYQLFRGYETRVLHKNRDGFICGDESK